ncbi:hypothetical protein KBB96_04835 [Luteolibacter ambystomatis]|uniref:Uncharacterized protein n=1 Tax=Luteolibacter ambystomatis TaxID=2824561 RepID=A0A975J1C2_9BACT|nr:hypothetical protein [Luteolibacter ambystomatis]QUE52218.1 hypothetical protein KBB96_04835 [Luteolibacter ambystomatis]
MADEAIPMEIVEWMRAREWGAHHDEWHFVRRWDFWRVLAAQGNTAAAEMVEYAEQQGWQRAEIQEGEAGNGLEFLSMHRAMLILLLRNFPQHMHFFRGWARPPLDPRDVEDPVTDGSEFDSNRAAALLRIEAPGEPFASEDDFGMFVETNLDPVADDPLHRHEDPRRGIHNYLHNRWTDENSPINLGDPKVNLENARFWKLHGWIDHMWWRFRRANGLSDTDATYKAMIDHYVAMMNEPGHHHLHGGHHAAPRPAGFAHSFVE